MLTGSDPTRLPHLPVVVLKQNGSHAENLILPQGFWPLTCVKENALPKNLSRGQWLLCGVVDEELEVDCHVHGLFRFKNPVNPSSRPTGIQVYEKMSYNQINALFAQPQVRVWSNRVVSIHCVARCPKESESWQRQSRGEPTHGAQSSILHTMANQ